MSDDWRVRECHLCPYPGQPGAYVECRTLESRESFLNDSSGSWCSCPACGEVALVSLVREMPAGAVAFVQLVKGGL